MYKKRLHKIVKYNNKHALTMALSCVILLSGCGFTKEPTFGERIQGQGVAVQEMGQQWSKGEKFIAEGNASIISGKKEIDKGEKLISEGKSKIRNGESLIQQGNNLKAGAEESYRIRNQNNIQAPL